MYVQSAYTDASNNPHHLVLVTYHIPPGFIPLVKSHGNSKRSIPFHPTWSSTKKEIREQCAVEGLKSVVATLSASVGGVLTASAPGQLPRDEKQVTNFRSRVSAEHSVQLPTWCKL